LVLFDNVPGFDIQSYQILGSLGRRVDWLKAMQIQGKWAVVIFFRQKVLKISGEKWA
jgi:hypothetical protein